VGGVRRLTISQARRVALAAQGLADPRPAGRVDIRHLRKAIAQVGALQIDSVNVLARAHLLTLFTRLGPFDPALLDDAAYRRRELVEYWAHEAAYAPMELRPFFRPRMEAYAARARGRRATLLRDDPGYVEAVRAELAARGPLQASELSDPGDRTGPWWGWSKGKVALEHLFAVGEIAVADRRGFARVYDLAERVVPAAVLAAPTPSPDEAHRALLLRAVQHQGVGTAADLADHYRFGVRTAQRVLTELVAEGAIEQVSVDGWSEPAYLDPQARRPRRILGGRLLNPFDPIVWCRPRLQRLFDVHYRIEIYVPPAQRLHGYYVLPFLLDEQIAARVDLKADRADGRLLVRGAWIEGDALPAAVVGPLHSELALMAAWLGLDEVVVCDHGDLARPLSAAAPGSGGHGRGRELVDHHPCEDRTKAMR
jgi:uncharacterized protein